MLQQVKEQFEALASSPKLQEGLDLVKVNARLRAFGLLKIPLINFLSPRITEYNDQRLLLKMPFGRRSKNHVNSMYFAVFAVGADLACGLIAYNEMLDSKRKIHLVFKDFDIRFLKRAEEDVIFVCEWVPQIKKLIHKTIETKDREELRIPVQAFIARDMSEPVADMHLTLSVKCKD